MANIKLKRGAGAPSGLTYGEPAFDITNSRLYIGITGGSALVGVAGGGVHSFNGLTGAVTGVTTGVENTFNLLQSFTSGISSSGGTFTNDITVNGVRVGEGGGSVSTNVAVGQSALNANTTGNNNTAIGYQTLLSGITAVNNTAVGSNALTLNIANNNTAVGQAALSVNTTGNSNVAIGYRALRDNTTGIQNVGIGQGALQFHLTGLDNTAVGRAAFLNLRGGCGNIALGSSTGRFAGLTGFPSGISLTQSMNSIFIGQITRPGGDSQSNQIVIAGYDGVGDGSDTTVIGNTATTSTRVFGTFITNGGVCAAGGVTFAGSLSGSTATFTGLITSTAGFSGTGITLSGNLSAATKSFVIPHPTKPSKQLQYACLEGPENGVYVRGRLKGSNVIELPEYWTALVHAESITVQLTGFGEYKNYFVKSIEGNKVTIGPRSKDTDCFYLVQAERKDVPRLTVEY